MAAIIVIALLALALSGQALTDAAVEEGTADTGRLLGRTGFAYLTGLRTFAAAALWNRLDPQFHEYYEGSLDNAQFTLPTMRIVTWLDPQFVEAYYTGPWIARRLGYEEEGLEFAREGVRENPRSGILIAQLAQFAFIDGHTEEAYEHALQALGDVDWRSLQDQFEGYGILRAVFDSVGDEEREAFVRAEMDHIVEELGGGETEPHDHDHDH
jgi:hypothetical protein